ncbi:IgG-binding virulence factor TspB family protein, partial [Xylophilus ampelinus]
MATITGNSTSVGIGSGGIPVATRAPTALGGTGGWSYAGNFGVGANASGGVIGGTATIPVGGVKVPISGTAKVASLSMGKAVGKFAAKVVPGLALFGATVELLADIGIFMKAGVGGQDNTFSTDDEGTANLRRAFYGGKWYSDPLAACKAYIGDATSYVIRGDAAYCKRGASEVVPVDIRHTCPDSTDPSGYVVVEPKTVCPGGTTRPVDQEELEQRIARESGWPDPKKLGNILAETIKSGQPVELEKPVITGPAKLPDTTDTKITTAPDGTKTTTTTKVESPISYDGDKVTVKPKTTTTDTTVKPDGSTKTDTTTTEEPTKESDDQKADLCKLHPEILACKEIDVPDQDVPKSKRTVTYSEDSFLSGGGSCPADKYASIHGVSTMVWDWQR